MAVQVHNPHSVLAAIETRPEEVVELAIPGVCPDRLDRENGEVRTFEKNVLGPRGKLGLVHSNERAKELSPPR